MVGSRWLVNALSDCSGSLPRRQIGAEGLGVALHRSIQTASLSSQIGIINIYKVRCVNVGYGTRYRRIWTSTDCCNECESGINYSLIIYMLYAYSCASVELRHVNIV